MIYLSGHVRDEFLSAWDLGVMLTPNMGNRPDLSRARWAADNGCFSQGDKFQAVKYMQWLDSKWAHAAQSRCLFATAPDVVGDAVARFDRALIHAETWAVQFADAHEDEDHYARRDFEPPAPYARPVEVA